MQKLDSTKNKKSIKDYAMIGVVSVCVVMFLIGIYNIFTILMDYRAIETANANLRESYLEVQDTGRRNVDWDSLIERNENVVGWIYFSGTSIDYPILEGETNETFLHTDIDGNHSIAGSIFLEENNNSSFMDLNTIIYGHHMQNGSKFADIDDIARGNDIAFEYIYIYLPNNTVNVYQVVSAQLTNIHSEIYYLPVVDLQNFYDLMLNNRTIDIPFDRSELPRVLTLSTCSTALDNDPSRSVVFAVLVDEIFM